MSIAFEEFILILNAKKLCKINFTQLSVFIWFVVFYTSAALDGKLTVAVIFSRIACRLRLGAEFPCNRYAFYSPVGAVNIAAVIQLYVIIIVLVH